MDILIKNIGDLPKDGDLTLTITPKGEIILGGCIFTHNYGKEVKAVALPEHGDLVEISKVKEAQCIHGQASPWERYVPVIVEANNGTDN